MAGRHAGLASWQQLAQLTCSRSLVDKQARRRSPRVHGRRPCPYQGAGSHHPAWDAGERCLPACSGRGNRGRRGWCGVCRVADLSTNHHKTAPPCWVAIFHGYHPRAAAWDFAGAAFRLSDSGASCSTRWHACGVATALVTMSEVGTRKVAFHKCCAGITVEADLWPRALVCACP